MTMTKWETNIEPYLTEVQMWAAQGRNQRDMASRLGVSYTTFNTALRQHKKLKDAIKQGKKRANRKVEKTLSNSEKPWTSKPKQAIELPLNNPGSRIGRPDRDGVHRSEFERNKKRILAMETVCGICGKPVDKNIKYPHPLSATVDHIIPVARGGHPSAIENLQLAHFTCNRQKSDKLTDPRADVKVAETISNRVLPHTFDWMHTDQWLK